MRTVAWWHCFAGIAGDMALASLVDAGADLDMVVEGLQALPFSGWHLGASRTKRSGLAATQLHVDVSAEDEGGERTWATIRQMLDQAGRLPDRARRRSQKIFARLAIAEGHLHGVPPEEVHFHEVGSTDAIIDVVGTCLALESLGVGSVRSSAVALGTGTVRSAHGLLPNPAPAVIELLSGVPVHGTQEPAELTTPTGAAILAALAEEFGPLPALTLTASGYGAGSRDLPNTPNVLQVVIGEMDEAGGASLGPGHDLVVVEANVDDVTGEVLAHTIACLMGAGALDAWLVPVVGKKGRPGHVVSVLCEAHLVQRLARVLASETGTLGLREHSVARWELARHALEVDVDGERVRVKVGPHRLKAEFDDCAAAAARLGLPLAEVARRAEQAASVAQSASSAGTHGPLGTQQAAPVEQPGL